MTDTSRIERTVELLREARLRVGMNRPAYLLIDTAIETLLEEIGFLTALELEHELVDLGRMIDDLSTTKETES